MKFRTDLLIEGVATADGRTIEPLATRLDASTPQTATTRPLFWWDPNQSGYAARRPVGAITSLVRENGRIVAEAELVDAGHVPADVVAWYRYGTLRIEPDLHLVDALAFHGHLLIHECSVLGAQVVCADAGTLCWPDLLRFEALP